jgi:selenocysteine-specific elongation factor
MNVVATAGHVDHGKSSLILRLTGMDPDRLAEEKRRGLTIDLGFAWCGLPSGREIGFVDVPGHERFIRNMLAGVGPVRLVMFVVAADEGWKPQSEEHLQIVDVLGASGGVVALTKQDLVDEETLASRAREVRAKLAGSRLADAAVVPCSAVTGFGLDALRAALDAMLERAPAPESEGRPRQFIDRVFTIKGAGTVVTGTLTGGPLTIGQEAEVLPTGHRARIRGLQTHRRSLETAQPVSRVAVNLAGTAKTELERGDVLTLPGQWRPTSMFEGWIRTVRGLNHTLTARGAYKLYAGSAERDARLRIFPTDELAPDGEAFVRVTVARPVVLDFKDSFVLREAGRQETVAGGGGPGHRAAAAARERPRGEVAGSCSSGPRHAGPTSGGGQGDPPGHRSVGPRRRRSGRGRPSRGGRIAGMALQPVSGGRLAGDADRRLGRTPR